jgi:hypothetical protein
MRFGTWRSRLRMPSLPLISVLSGAQNPAHERAISPGTWRGRLRIPPLPLSESFEKLVKPKCSPSLCPPCGNNILFRAAARSFSPIYVFLPLHLLLIASFCSSSYLRTNQTCPANQLPPDRFLSCIPRWRLNVSDAQKFGHGMY